MDERTQAALGKFEAALSAEERQAVVRHLLSEALVEIPCCQCARGRFVLPPGRTAAFECPACGARTYARQDGAALAMVSEARLRRILRFAAARPWFCPEHAGVRVAVTGVAPDPDNPLAIRIQFNCRRARGWGRARVHAGVREENALSLEAAMPAAP